MKDPLCYLVLRSFVCCFYYSLFREVLGFWWGQETLRTRWWGGGSWAMTMPGWGGWMDSETGWPWELLPTERAASLLLVWRGFGCWGASGGEQTLVPALPVIFQKGKHHLPGFHVGEPATKERRNGCLRRCWERISGCFKIWHLEWSPGRAGRKNTEANLTAGSHINVKEKDKACGHGQR